MEREIRIGDWVHIGGVFSDIPWVVRDEVVENGKRWLTLEKVRSPRGVVQRDENLCWLMEKGK